MVSRQNHNWICAYLDRLRTITQPAGQTIGRYGSYRRHVLLWPAARPRAGAFRFPAGWRPLISPPTTLNKIRKRAQCFLRWARQSYPREFRDEPERRINSFRKPRQAESLKEQAPSRWRRKHETSAMADFELLNIVTRQRD
jgi:hypothetical protein